jgi:hypothetical protein
MVEEILIVPPRRRSNLPLRPASSIQRITPLIALQGEYSAVETSWRNGAAIEFFSIAFYLGD